MNLSDMSNYIPAARMDLPGEGDISIDDENLSKLIKLDAEALDVRVPEQFLRHIIGSLRNYAFSELRRKGISGHKYTSLVEKFLLTVKERVLEYAKKNFSTLLVEDSDSVYESLIRENFRARIRLTAQSIRYNDTSNPFGQLIRKLLRGSEINLEELFDIGNQQSLATAVIKRLEAQGYSGKEINISDIHEFIDSKEFREIIGEFDTGSSTSN